MKEEEKEPKTFKMVLPECCTEGWSSCKHVKKPEEPKDVNPV